MRFAGKFQPDKNGTMKRLTSQTIFNQIALDKLVIFTGTILNIIVKVDFNQINKTKKLKTKQYIVH